MGAVIEDRHRTVLELAGLAGFLGGIGQIATAFGLVDSRATAAQKKALSSAAAYGAAGAGIAGMLLRAGTASGNLSRLENSLSLVTGSARSAHEQMDAIQGTSASQLFGTDVTARAALNLRNMGADADLTRLTISGMANATSAAAGDQSDFMAATEAVARAIQTEHLGMRDLRAIMRASGPAFKLLADSMGLTVPQLENMEFRGQNAIRVIHDLMDAENRVHRNAAQSDLDTLPGQMGRLQHRAEDAGRAIGRSVETPLKNAVRWAADLVDAFDRLPSQVHEGAAVGGVGLAGFLGVRSLTGLAGMLGTLPRFAGIAARLAPLAGMARIANPYGLISLAGEFGSSFIPDRRLRAMGEAGFTGFGVGGVLGAVLGRTPQTALGGALLGGIGSALLAGMLSGNTKPGSGSARPGDDPHLSVQQQQLEELRKLRGDIATMARGETFDTKDMAGGLQALAAYRMARATR
jgi:tape measure domain-containing protein